MYKRGGQNRRGLTHQKFILDIIGVFNLTFRNLLVAKWPNFRGLVHSGYGPLII